MADIEHYSQNDEQEVILQYFGDYIGSFLDIGAYDGKTLSNTHALALKGWEGVCVEPSPETCEKLGQLYEGNGDVMCLEIAIGDKTDKVEFYDTPGDFYGSLTKGNGERYDRKEVPIIVQCWTPENLFHWIGYDFDFISLDVEQNNLDVLKGIPFEKLSKLSLICVEHDGKQKEIIDFLKSFGFIELHRTNENIILKFRGVLRKD